MNRIEKVRTVIDEILLNMTDSEERRCAYLHLYGVAQACALLALKRGENVELAIAAGMLHDIYSYAKMDSRNHAHEGAEMARDILKSLQLFDESEENMICAAIAHHSDKSERHGSLDEILKDADVMQHVLYNPLLEVKQTEQKRFDDMKSEFDLGNLI
ncbi:MAG: HD domain-containing protein [Clostridia bacterium]|nr:HD domain-containing protein [Clostridia bacterium]